MNAERLLAHYERIADAPDAIRRLRRLILDLAVRGKLVPQDPSEVPASELLKRIRTKKARLVKEGKIKRDQEPPPSAEAAKPFVLPDAWLWARFAEVAAIQSNLVDPRGYKSHPHIAPDNIESGTGRLLPYDTIGNSGVFSAKHLFEPGCLLYSKIRPALAKVVLADFEGLCSADMYPVLSFIDRGYLQKFMLAEVFVRQSVTEDNRVAMPKINQEALVKILVAVPPLAEQHRIVAKVDELMALCDRLEAARTAREATRDRLTAASLARLNAPNPDTFKADAHFVLDALPALTTRPDQIKQLRQTILNLAVRGKVAPQDAKDEPAPRFDRSIPDNLAPPFRIPTNWSWSRLNALGKLKGGGTPSKARGDFWNGSIPWVSPKDMKVDHITEAQMSITDAAVTGSAVNVIEPESVLFVVRGMILAHSFPVAISRVPLTINQDMKALVLKKPPMAEYLLRALKGLKPEMLTRVQRSSHGTCRIEGADYSDFLVPIPPLAEQRRIVAKVDELMALCDRLEASLAAAEGSRWRLMEALLKEALAPGVADSLEEVV